jgi:glycerol-3-phosphate acyltransferase PlsY
MRSGQDHDVVLGAAWDGLLVATALAAVLGHNFTPWLGFKGGKGIATSAGVLAALLPASLGVILTVWIVLFALTRIVSVASIAASAALPVATWFLYPHRPVFFGFALAAGVLAIVQHRANIGRLLRGEEKRMGSKKKEQP